MWRCGSAREQRLLLCGGSAYGGGGREGTDTAVAPFPRYLLIILLHKCTVMQHT
ncbi:hypothetical protein C2845_PM05G37040 [Panicum miliaceum]|uniref:Uncharacterized protein n=1 Tax=Panicum miliaceum TaxID=4540 RepID=A0A3L6SVC2_PANMI|nr:hypothetical protein C2845_PM05G37040 [Panicum miliaceum]